MSGIAGATDVGTLNSAIYNMDQTQKTIDALTAETSSGYVASDYAGLGSGAGSALDLTSQLALNATQQSNADAAGTVQSVAQTALGQIQSLVAGMASQLLSTAVTSSTEGLSSLASTAQNDLAQVASLLDTKSGDVYVFAGQDSANPPVPDPSGITQSAFYAAIESAVAGLDANGAAATQAQILTIASPGGTSPFSATLEASNQPATVDLGDGQSVQVGMLADQNSDAVSAGTGSTSTGSYMRDILMAFSTVGALGNSSAGDSQVQSLLTSMQGVLSNADSAINTDIAGLGARQDTITSAKSELGDVATSLTTQLGNIENADQTTVATSLSTAETQLQASYAVIAALGKLTLSTFLEP
jgi:flagellar hook-associated protein 3 FlgL